ncbi:MAG: phenylacetate--CoA ligase family protein [Candidatus Thorarchaeota archaeon]
MADKLLRTTIVDSFYSSVGHERLSRQMMKSNQDQLIRRIVKYAYDFTPFYRRIMKKHKITPSDIRGIEDLSKIPIVDKAYVKQHLADFFSRRSVRYNMCASSGSTGQPLEYRTSLNHWSLHSGVLLQSFTWGGWCPGDKLVTVAGETIFPKPSTIKETFTNLMRSWLQDNKSLSTFHMNPKSIRNMISEMYHSKARFFRGLPSGITEVIGFLEKEGITPPSFEAIFTTSEKLWPVQKEKIEKAFNSPVYDQYGARDGGAQAFQCEHGHYHYLPHVAVWEILDENGMPVGPGEEGRLILTDLHNFATLFIRYEVGDYIIRDVDETCECGRTLPTIQSIEGRTMDVIKSPTGYAVHGEVFGHIFRYVFPFVKQFQIKQISPEIVLVQVVNQKDTRIDRTELLKLLEYNLPDIEFQIQEVEEIPLTKGGKRRFIIGLDS